MLQLEKQKVSGNIIKNSENIIEPIDPTLHLKDNDYIRNENEEMNLRDNIDIKSSSVKNQLISEFFKEIMNSPNIPEEEKENNNIIYQKIIQKKFYYCYDNNNFSEKVLEDYEQIMAKPQILNIPETIDYDIELTKIGSKCDGLKKRFAVINRGELLSSTKPKKELKEKDIKNLKNKTEYLKGSNIYFEKYNEQGKPQGEWIYKAKPYRIRIDYLDKPENKKNKMKSICLYFDEEKKEIEVFEMLFEISLSEDKKNKIKETLDRFEQSITKQNKFYSLMKILSVKNKIKKRKKGFDKIHNAYEGSICAKFNHKVFQIKMAKDKKLRAIPDPKPQKPKESFQRIHSDFIPLISKISSEYGVKDPKIKKSLNLLLKTYELLKDEIPSFDKNNLDDSDNGISFIIPNGVQIEKNIENDNFQLSLESCQNAKYIYFDKNKPEIKFKNDNNIDENMKEVDNKNIDIDNLSYNNIYEISNIILNSDINMNGKSENNLIICGPKIDNNKSITYKYNEDDNLYLDPEIMNIKAKTNNVCNKENIKGITIQIYQSEIEINEFKLQELLVNLTQSVNEVITLENLKENILFGYIIKLSNLKSIESAYVPPKEFKNKICFIEYNHQYFIPEDYKDSTIIIECFCLPTLSFSQKEKKKYIGLEKYLSPIKLGYVKLNYNDNQNYQYKYPIEIGGIPEANSFLILDKCNGSFDNTKLKNIHGKDYSIGSNSYIEKIVDSKFFENEKQNENLSDEIKEKYFNVCLDNDDILLRPNEDDDNFDNSFITQLTNANEQEPQLILRKIKQNKKFSFLPYCEKYENEKTLCENKNLNLSDEQIEYVKNNYNRGDWIYKLPKIKIKLLSKNLGCKERTTSQLIYCTDEKKEFSYDALTKGINEKVIPISENNFNILDMNEISEINNIDNFQWKMGIKFINKLYMNTFIKLLLLARQNINTKEKNKIENKTIEFEVEKMIEFYNEKLKGKNNKNYEIIVEFVDFVDKIILKNEQTYLKIKLAVEKDDSYQTIFNNMQDTKYGFINSLAIKNQKIKSKVDYTKSNEKYKLIELDKKVKLDIKKFNSGNRHLSFREKMKSEFDINTNIINSNNNSNNISNNIINNNSNNISNNINNDTNSKKLEILIILSEKNETNKDEFFSTVDFTNLDSCTKLELPIYKKEKNDPKIYGCLGINLYEKKGNNTFNEEYEKINNNYFNNPLLLLRNEKLNEQHFLIWIYHFGLYEPNIFRRKILNYVHNAKRYKSDKEKRINVDPCNLGNSTPEDLDCLYESLMKRCVKLPEKELFSSFDFCNIIKNYDNSENSYKKKLALKLLKINRHENFMKEFRKVEWELYMNRINKGEKGMDNIVYIQNNSDKKAYIENENDSKTLRDLIYLGIPNKYRITFYNSFLETHKLYEKTREVLNSNEKIDRKGELSIFSYFADQIINKENETNLIFSLIDNDCTLLYSHLNITLEDIKSIKKIAKSFFIWAKLGIGIDKNDKYAYFIGILFIIQKFRQITDKEHEVFWLIIGLSQYLDHFHQRNALFTEEMNYINLYGLVCKLILETHQRKIYEKFISLNFPPEFFFSQHLSTLYTDYFNHKLMLRILDILIYESSFKILNNDKLQSLRVLCAIPITIIELNQNRILACESVSEIDSIFNDLASHTFNYYKFINALEKNIRKFFVCSSFLERYIWLFNNKGREWDEKRADLENLILDHFKPVYKENINYLFEINKLLNQNTKEMYNNYFENLDNKFKPIKSVYYQHDSYFDDSSNMETWVMIHVSKLQQIYNNDTKNLKEYKLNISFGNNNILTEKKKKKEFDLSFDNVNNRIKNIQELYFKEKFEGYNFPKFIHFELTDTNGNKVASFVYQVLHYEPMKISKIIVENKESHIKYFLEFVIFKSTSKKLASDDSELYNIIFGPPEYLHSISIEDKLYSYSIYNSSFRKKVEYLINEENKTKNKLLSYKLFDEIFDEKYKFLNNSINNLDGYNIENLKNANNIISSKVISVLNSFIENDTKQLVIDWLRETNVSLEEVFYSLILIDKSLNTINDKLFLLYSIAQTKDKILFSNERLSINKAKEIFYSLYKRFMIYFTKTDVERMIDFLLKDERLFNVKYAFIYSKKNRNKINEFIYDKDRYEPKLNDKKSFEIYFDNLDKQFNLYLNHLNNHYKIQSISKDIIQLIFSEILNKNNDILNLYRHHKFDCITLVIEKDNMIFKRNYSIELSPISIVEDDDLLFNILPKSYNQNETEIVDYQLCHEISNFDTTNSYCINNYISFETFKDIFFKLPYLGDLFRVNFSYIQEYENSMINEFDNFKVSVDYEENLSTDEYKIKDSDMDNKSSRNNNYGEFYFPIDEEENTINNNEKNIYEMNSKIKISDTVDSIIEKIFDYLKSKNRLTSKENFMLNNIKGIDKLMCYIFYYSDENTKKTKNKEKIGCFDRLYSCMALKDKHCAELKIIFNANSFSFISNLSKSKNLISRENGYCKIFYSDNNDFQWKKCKIKLRSNNNVKLTSVDYKTKPLLKEDDVILAYNI